MKKFAVLFVLGLITVTSFAVEVAPDLSPVVLSEVTAANPSLPYFWLNFVISFVGAYTIYGILAGPTMFGGTYILTNNKKDRRNALWGFLLGMALGITLKIWVLG